MRFLTGVPYMWQFHLWNFTLKELEKLGDLIHFTLRRLALVVLYSSSIVILLLPFLWTFAVVVAIHFSL